MKTIHKSYALSILEKENGSNGQKKKFLVIQRSHRQRWLKGLWEFPMVQIPKTAHAQPKEKFLKTVCERLKRKMKTEIQIERPLGRIVHAITRHRLKIFVVKGTVGNHDRKNFLTQRWAALEDLKKISSSSILSKALALL